MESDFSYWNTSAAHVGKSWLIVQFKSTIIKHTLRHGSNQNEISQVLIRGSCWQNEKFFMQDIYTKLIYRELPTLGTSLLKRNVEQKIVTNCLG